MGVSLEFILGSIGAATVAVVGFFLTRSITQVDENIESLRESRHAFGDVLHGFALRLQLVEERLKWLTQELEDHKNGRGHT